MRELFKQFVTWTACTLGIRILPVHKIVKGVNQILFFVHEYAFAV